MFGKKKTNDITMDDKRIIEITKKIEDEAQHLCAAVEKVIIVTGIINLYPDGPDKDAAVKKAEAAKHSLLCRIGAYDELLAECNSKLPNLKNRCFTVGLTTNYCSSHELIEIAYRNFYKRG